MGRILVRAAGIAAIVASVSTAFVTRAAAPAGRYTITNGTVYDNKTKLTWQQASMPGTYTLSQAMTYCSGLSLSGAAWRLPTFKEFVTIVDYSTVNSSTGLLDPTAFPNALNNTYWTSTPYVPASGKNWQIDTGSGTSTAGGPAGNDGAYVRCVQK